MSELDGIVVRPEMHEEQPRLLIKHMTVQGRDLDSSCAQSFDHRIDLIGGQYEVTRDCRLAAASRLKANAGRHPGGPDDVSAVPSSFSGSRRGTPN